MADDKKTVTVKNIKTGKTQTLTEAEHTALMDNKEINHLYQTLKPGKVPDEIASLRSQAGNENTATQKPKPGASGTAQ